MNNKMSISFHHIERLQDPALEKKLLNLLVICDRDFEPTLSSSRLKDQKHATQQDKLNEYIREKKATQEWLFVLDRENLIGFANFKQPYESNLTVLEQLKTKELDNNDVLFIDTMVFLPLYRKQGIGQRLYYEFENIIRDQEERKVVIRSASTNNETQMHLFQKQGYRLLYETPYYRDERVMKGYFYKII